MVFIFICLPKLILGQQRSHLLFFKDKKYNDYLKKILELYFDKKNKQFLELSFSCDYFTKENYEDWALFISYHNNKSFLKSFKTKFNTDFTPKLSYSLL